jgi:hypothetical protein
MFLKPKFQKESKNEGKGGRMVKEWDFEAGNFFKNSKKIK